MNTTESLLIPVDNLVKRFLKLVRSGSTTNNTNRLDDQFEAIEIVDVIRDFARSLADTTDTQVVNRWFYFQLMNKLARCTFGLVELRERTHWQRYRREIESKIRWATHQYGFGLTQVNDKVENSHIDDLADRLTLLGLFGLSKGNDTVAEIAIQNIGLMAAAYTATSSRDREYEAPRIMMNIYHISAAAIQKQNHALLVKAHQAVRIFRKVYRSKLHSKPFKLPPGATYYGTYPDQFNREMSHYISSIRHPNPMVPRGMSLGDESPEDYAMRMFGLNDAAYEAARWFLKRD